MILRIASIVLPIFFIVALGYVYARVSRPHLAEINKVNMDVFLPALIFHVLSQEGFSPGRFGGLAVAGMLIILGSGLLAYLFALRFRIQWRTLVPPMMFTNYGNLGLPLFAFAFGETALSAAVVLFMVGNVLHFTLGRFFLDRAIHPVRLLRTPIILASAGGLIFNLGDMRLAGAVAIPIEMLGQVSIPLMLFSLGVRLTDVDWGDWRLGVAAAILCPASGVLIALGILYAVDFPDQQAAQLLLFGALPPAVLNYLFAEQFGQEPRKVASIVMIGTLASIFVIPLVLAFLL